MTLKEYEPVGNSDKVHAEEKKENKIKFSHSYYKLQGISDTAVLILATPYKIDSNTPKEFIAYDTWYYPDGHYELKPGDYVLLLFLGSKGVFTTIRQRKSRNGDKLEFYSKHIGEIFTIEIQED